MPGHTVAESTQPALRRPLLVAHHLHGLPVLAKSAKRSRGRKTHRVDKALALAARLVHRTVAQSHGQQSQEKNTFHRPKNLLYSKVQPSASNTTARGGVSGGGGHRTLAALPHADAVLLRRARVRIRASVASTDGGVLLRAKQIRGGDAAARSAALPGGIVTKLARAAVVNARTRARTSQTFAEVSHHLTPAVGLARRGVLAAAARADAPVRRGRKARRWRRSAYSRRFRRTRERGNSKNRRATKLARGTVAGAATGLASAETRAKVKHRCSLTGCLASVPILLPRVSAMRWQRRERRKRTFKSQPQHS